MKKPSILREKSFAFSIQIVEICRFCKDTNAEFALYNQLLRSGTAVGALIREAEYAQSKSDFINKLSIALKEANETAYWIDILVSVRTIERHANVEMIRLLDEIIRMLVSSINTAKGVKREE